MERAEQNEGKTESGYEASGGSSEFGSSAGSGRWSESDSLGGAGSTGNGSSTRNVFVKLKDRAEDGWGWARKNPWPVVGVAIGIGLLLAWRRRSSDASHRLAHMNADHPVGRSQRHETHHMDEVAEGMGR
jgi:hypothetical protein